MSCYLYILENDQRRHYTGITELLPEDRLRRHNQGDVYSTRKGKPWRLIHTEKHHTVLEARAREKQIKSWKGGVAFKNLILEFGGRLTCPAAPP